MNDQQVYERLTEIFRDLFDDDSIVLSPEMTAADVAGWDSFNHVMLITAAEATFNVKFYTSEMESLRNVGHFVEIIESKLGR